MRYIHFDFARDGRYQESFDLGSNISHDFSEAVIVYWYDHFLRIVNFS